MSKLPNAKYYILLIFLLNISIFCSSNLLTVIELNRHGARTPKFFPDASSLLYFGSNSMQLTINGYRQHQIIGQYVKEHYINKLELLNKDYDSNQFKLISSATQRTIFSAAGYLSGLFPDYVVKMHFNHSDTEDKCPLESNIDKNEFLSFKEIPIFVVDPKQDSFFKAVHCLYNKEVLYKYFIRKELFKISTIDIKNMITELKAVFKQLNINLPTTNLNDDVKEELREIINFYDPFAYHFKNQIKLSKTSETVIKKYTLNKWYGNRTQKQSEKYLNLSVSSFLVNLMKHFKSTIENYNNNISNKDKKLIVYSGHDTNIVNLISALSDKSELEERILKAIDDEIIYKSLVPEFASSLFFELHVDKNAKEQNVFYVIVYFNNNSILHLDFSYFEDKINKIIDVDYQKLDCSEHKDIE